MRFVFLAAIVLLYAGHAMAHEFTYNIQWAGYAFDRYDEKGPITYEQFVTQFKSFPWATQVGKANGGSEPTISVRDHANNIDCWVSAAASQSSYVYLVGVVYLKEKPGILGIGKPKRIRWVEIYVAQDAGIVERMFQIFFSGRDEELMRQLHSLPKFGEMQAKN